MSTITIKGTSIVAGRYCEPAGNVFYSFNHLTGRNSDTPFYEANQQIADKAITAAAAVFIQFRKTLPEKLVLLLNNIADELELNRELIIETCASETGIEAEQLDGEMNRTLAQIRMFAGFVSDNKWKRNSADEAIPDKKPFPKPGIKLTLFPVGVVGVFGAGNFPLAFSVAGGDTISALAAGCPVVYKSHPGHPGTSELVALCIYKAVSDTGLPAEIFSLLHGKSPQTGKYIVSHPLISAVGFTGSQRGGRELFDICNKRKNPIPFYGEMGSNNPVFILPEAMKKQENLAENFYNSLTLRNGQFCTNPGMFVFIENSDSDKFLHRFSELISTTDVKPMYSSDISEKYHKKLREFLGKNIILKRSEGKKSTDKLRTSPVLMTVSAKRFIGNPDLFEEIFGPATLGIAAKSIFDILQVASVIPGQLTATIHAQEGDLFKYSELINILEEKCGRIIMNGFPTGVEVCNSMQHGGPYPASTFAGFTSVGVNSIYRWVRPVSYQNFDSRFLPDELK